jgi:hypothetical protein
MHDFRKIPLGCAILLWTLLYVDSTRADAPDPALGSVRIADTASAKRGFTALTTRSFTPANFPAGSLQTVWKLWTKSKPGDPVGAARERFGLSEAPYPNNGMPMGLRSGSFGFGISGISLDCMVCHGGSILGKPFLGLGNANLDLQALFEELPGAGTRRLRTPYQFSRARGTNEAGATAVFLLGFRDADLGVHLTRSDLKPVDTLCEDVPAWWLLKKKATMYATGEGDARSVRSIMQFSMSPLHGKAWFEKEESTFRDILNYLYTIEAPKYPFPVNPDLAKQGEKVFRQNCAKCHGTYGNTPAYPNKIIPEEEVQTDSHRLKGFPEAFGKKYTESWFTREREGWFADGYQGRVNHGYQAPPLDGIWASAPYLHNGSVPTLGHLLDSKTRPIRFTRTFRTEESEYDKERVGWKVRPVGPLATPTDPHEARKIYDTGEIGRGNGGHTYGDSLSDAERLSLLEYLKTL